MYYGAFNAVGRIYETNSVFYSGTIPVTYGLTLSFSDPAYVEATAKNYTSNFELLIYGDVVNYKTFEVGDQTHVIGPFQSIDFCSSNIGTTQGNLYLQLVRENGSDVPLLQEILKCTGIFVEQSRPVYQHNLGRIEQNDAVFWVEQKLPTIDSQDVIYISVDGKVGATFSILKVNHIKRIDGSDLYRFDLKRPTGLAFNQ